MRKTLREFHVSHVECLARCQREYEYKYVWGVSPPERGHLQTGTGMHRGIAAMRQGISVEDAWRIACVGMDETSLPVLRVLQMLRGYHEYWSTPGRWDGPPLAGSRDEATLSAPLVNPATRRKSLTYCLVGTPDAIINGNIIYELKTTSDTIDETERYLREGIQLPVYGELLHLATGIEPLSYVIDVVKKPTVRSRKGEAPVEYAKRMLEDYRSRPEHFFRRAEVSYRPSHRRWAMEIVWRSAAHAREVLRSGGLAVCGWSCCKRGDGWCGYKSLCWYGETDAMQLPPDMEV